MWKDLTPPWQAAFEEAWAAFCAGSTPIGAALTDEDGSLLLKDRNRNNESETLNRRIAHAEANLLRRLDTKKHEPRRVTLYTTMEPCPMCMGAVLMSSIKRVRSAAYDSYCGMVHLCESEPYYIAKKVDHAFECGEKELVQLTVQGYFELRHIQRGSSSKVFDRFEKHLPQAAATAKKLFENHRLDELAESGAHISQVYDMIVSAAENDSDN